MITATGALTHMKKAFYYMEQLAESNKSFYQSTRRTIREMMDICSDILEIGKDLVGEDKFRRRGRSEQELEDKAKFESINARMDKMENMIEKMMKQTVVAMTPNTVRNWGSGGGDIDDSSPVERVTSSPLYHNKAPKKREPGTPRPFNVRWVSNIRQALSCLEEDVELMQNEHKLEPDSPEVILSRMVVDWYDTRILRLDQMKSSFRYRISDMPYYFEALVADYCMQAPRDPEFVSKFYDWLQNIKENHPVLSSYGLPYTSFEIYKKLKEEGHSYMKVLLREDTLQMYNTIWKFLSEYGLDVLDQMEQAMKNAKNQKSL